MRSCTHLASSVQRRLPAAAAPHLRRSCTVAVSSASSVSSRSRLSSAAATPVSRSSPLASSSPPACLLHSSPPRRLVVEGAGVSLALGLVAAVVDGAEEWLNQPRALRTMEEAVEIVDESPDLPTRLMMTCEHASMRLPAPWKWPSADSRLLGQHWSFDPGAEDFTRELAAQMPSVAVLGRFSRLLCDPNRPLGSPTMFRDTADNLPVHLNDASVLTKEEEQRRVDALYKPYHAAVQRVFDAVQPSIILQPHSFTPVYEGQVRTVEIGVLFNPEKDRPLAEKFKAAYEAAGIVTALNEPWSGQAGFMYAVDKFSSESTRSIMFEFRQDLIVDPKWRRKVVDITREVLQSEGHDDRTEARRKHQLEHQTWANTPGPLPMSVKEKK